MVKRNMGTKTKKFSEMNKKKTAIKKKEMSTTKGSAFKKSASSSNPHRPDPAGGKPGSQFRTRATIKRLKMYNSKPASDSERKKTPNDPTIGRIEPDRKWFGNTRTVDQKELDKFRKNLAEHQEKKGSGFSVTLKSKKLPLALVKDTYHKTLSEGDRLLQVQSFEHTFGSGSQRKRPTLKTGELEDLMHTVEKQNTEYDETKDFDYHKNDFQEDYVLARHSVFDKGLSKRIWEELYKVVDSSDVLIYVLDGRNPNGTRTKYLEDYLKNKCPSKHLVFILNKCDLVPTSVTQKWVKYLNQFAPTLAFQASLQNPFGKGSLIQLLRQFDILHKDKKSISVGFIGYPNVGKSSIINALKKKNVCKVAPIPGETKVWQYITLTKRIYLIDCPGIVYDVNETETDKVLKGVVRAEKIPDPDRYIQAILDKVEKKHIYDIFGIRDWADSEDFISQVAVRTGKLLKGGDPDLNNVCKTIIFDWQRGKIPFFHYPPREADLKEDEEPEVAEAEAEAVGQVEEEQ